MNRYRFAVIGAGIVGLSTATALSRRFPGHRLLVLEKEAGLSRHQTGNNSGVVHSGIYYRPGSLKARLARAGNRSLVRFCRERGIAHEICGKVIVATEREQLAGLQSLLERGIANGLKVRRLDAERLRELEPHASGLAAIHVPSTGIVDFRMVAAAFAEIVEGSGGEIHLGTRVEGIHEDRDAVTLETGRGTFRADFLINCGGLHSDRLARLGGLPTGVKIVPFRGEYYELRPERRHLVRSLIYPVPNPDFPFLGVHFTRMIDGGVHAGPNAVLSLSREGYEKGRIDLRDAVETLTYPGFWRLATRHIREGVQEVVRSASKRAFLRSLQRLVPDVRLEDLVPARAGVRAQALLPDGGLVDDFLILPGRRSLHVCNAPSPAATACIEIGEALASRVARLPSMEAA